MAGDIDPKLLVESGRASAVQDLADQAAGLKERSEAIEASVVSALAEQLRWWRRAAKTAAVIIVVLFILLGISGWNRVSLNGVDRMNRFITNLCEQNPEARPLCEDL